MGAGSIGHVSSGGAPTPSENRCRGRGNDLKGFKDVGLKKWLKSRPESALDCLICSLVDRERKTLETCSCAYEPDCVRMNPLRP